MNNFVKRECYSVKSPSFFTDKGQTLYLSHFLTFLTINIDNYCQNTYSVYNYIVSINTTYSVTTEALRVIHDLYHLNKGFYLANGWYPVEYTNSPLSNDVCFAKIQYNNLNTQIQEICKYRSANHFKISNDTLIKIFENELLTSGSFIKINEVQLNKYHKNVVKVLKPAITKASSTFSHLKNKKINVNVSPTHFGTCGSFSYASLGELQQNKDIDVTIYIRLDQKVENTIEYLASSLSRGFIDHLPWQCTEAVSDFITKYVFDYTDHTPTLDKVKQFSPQRLQNSLTFLHKNKLPTGKLLEYNDMEHKIYLLGQNISKELTQYEFRALRQLIKNTGTTVTFDELSAGLYKTDADEKFTFWGITKTIQRVRNKLEKLGVPREQIVNVKGQGFKLIS